MVAVPADTPFTIPVVPIVATAVLLLLQVPPAVASVKGMVWPWHTPVGPAIATGDGFTAIITVALQPPTV